MGLRRAACGATAWTLEVFLDPWFVDLLDDIKRVGDENAFLRQHGNAVADRVQRVEVMGDQEHGQAEAVAQGQDQLVEGRRTDRVESGGRFIEKQDLDPAQVSAPAQRA